MAKRIGIGRTTCFNALKSHYNNSTRYTVNKIKKYLEAQKLPPEDYQPIDKETKETVLLRSRLAQYKKT